MGGGAAFSEPARNESGYRRFLDKGGEVLELPWSAVKRPGLARDEEKIKAEADKRLYNNRSRTTAKQRGQQPATEKQRRYLIGLARRRGLSIEDLRDMTPQKSVRELTVYEAGRLIDRFLGKSRKTGS